jgi:hypothetical protein
MPAANQELFVLRSRYRRGHTLLVKITPIISHIVGYFWFPPPPSFVAQLIGMSDLIIVGDVEAADAVVLPVGRFGDFGVVAPPPCLG